MISCYSKNTVGWPKTTNIAPEIPTYHRIELSIYYISREEYQIGLESIYFFDDSLDMAHTVRRPEVYIGCYCNFQTPSDFIFFLYFELVSAYFWISGVDIAESNSQNSSQYSEIGEMVADGIYLFFSEPREGMVDPEKNIINNTDKEKMYYTDKPERSKCN